MCENIVYFITSECISILIKLNSTTSAWLKLYHVLMHEFIPYSPGCVKLDIIIIESIFSKVRDLELGVFEHKFSHKKNSLRWFILFWVVGEGCIHTMLAKS